MKKTLAITIEQDKDWLLIRLPRYSESFRSQITDPDVLPRLDRTWDNPVWKVRSTHLETVRSIVASAAQEEGWEVLDTTAHSSEEIEQQKQAIAQQDLDQHIEAVLAVLPKLPKHTLRLVNWQEGSLWFELATYLEDQDLFKELAQASLKSFRPDILWPGNPKREFAQTFILAEDQRILQALCQLVEVTPIGNDGWRSAIQYFVVRQIPCTQKFPDGIAHFTDETGAKWVGVPYRDIGWDLSGSYEPWQVLLLDTVVYRLFHCKRSLNKLISVREYQYVNPGVGFIVAQSHPSMVTDFVILTHLEEWFKTWGNELVQRNDVKKSMFGEEGWYEFQYEHPADELLAHVSWTRRGGPEMAALLGWSKADVETYRERVKQLKSEAAQRVIDDMRNRSSELALPRLYRHTIDQLVQLALKHNITLKKSRAKKEDLAQTLATYPVVCEDILGLTKRLEKEHQGPKE